MTTLPGIWKHYKGGLYVVLFVAHNCTNGKSDGTKSVVYAAPDGPGIFTRNEDEWHELVESPTARCRVPRFELVQEF